MIPWRRFWQMYDDSERIETKKRFEMALAVAHGIAMAMDGKNSKTKSMTRRLVRRAEPEVKD